MRNSRRFEQIVRDLYEAHTGKMLYTERDTKIRELLAEIIEVTSLQVDGIEQTQVHPGSMGVISLEVDLNKTITGLLYFDLAHLVDATGRTHTPPVSRHGSTTWKLYFDFKIVAPKSPIDRITVRPTFIKPHD